MLRRISERLENEKLAAEGSQMLMKIEKDDAVSKASLLRSHLRVATEALNVIADGFEM